MLHITGDTVTLSRYGKVNTHMAFERGKRFICAYPLGDGKFDEAAYLSGIAPITHFPTVCVTTKALENNIGAEGGNMLIDYLVEIGGNTAEHNEYHITVRPV
ncbi:hypothetical protein SDC9_156431 [bioreactor metagenome]|uniref:Uncharacterized protein n=1 Tax=bioreactor metagenome TaxID=1076179 RepID=A0A645F9K2_9ZZZZ